MVPPETERVLLLLVLRLRLRVEVVGDALVDAKGELVLEWAEEVRPRR